MERTGRTPRIHTPNTIHHVMIRGNNRQRVFFEKKYFEEFLEIVKQSTEKFDHKIIAYCLMSNHAHVVIHIHQSSLSSVMQNINYRYARLVNYKQTRIGHLFQGRYRSIEVKDERYLVNLCRYIHLNPVAANMVKDPQDYPWSSHKNYVDGNAPSWMTIDRMLSVIKNQTTFNYIDFMHQSVDHEKWKPNLYLSETGNIVINENAIQQLDEITFLIPRSTFLSCDLVCKIVCNYLNVDLSVLCGKSANHELSKQRILLAYYLLKFSNIKMSDIAKLFHRTQGTLSRQYVKLLNNLEKDFLSALLRRIEEELECAKVKKGKGQKRRA